MRVAVLVSRLRNATVLARGLIIDGWGRIKQAMVVGPGFWDHAKQATAICLAMGLRVWHGVKRAWFRILVGLFMAGVTVAACYWTWSVWDSWRLADLASVTRTWPNQRILNNVAVEIQTKCSDSVLSYVVVIVPPKSSAALTLAEKTDFAKVSTDRIRERLKALHLKFIDKDGFPTAAYDIAIDSFIRMYSSNEERLTSLEARDTLACSPTSYVRAETLLLSWTERHE